MMKMRRLLIKNYLSGRNSQKSGELHILRKRSPLCGDLSIL